MNLQPIKFVGFEGREEELKKVIRYHPYKPMFYRTDLWVHSWRVLYLLESLLPILIDLFPNFDVEAARRMALVHDDFEIIMGDVQFGSKLKMNEEELLELKKIEEDSIRKICQCFPENIDEYNYFGLLKRAQEVDPNDVEAVAVKYCDKLDGHCEALHEVMAGNGTFLKGYEWGVSSPNESYKLVFGNLLKYFGILKTFFETKHPLIGFPIDIDFSLLVKNGSLHTLELVNRETGLPHYDFWKNITLQKFTNGLELLTLKKE